MKIALDYDGTYTLDPDFWQAVRTLAEDHHVIDIMVVTARPEEERPHPPGFEVFCTGGEAKEKYMKEKEGITIDIWIDDEPRYIVEDKY